VFFINIPIGIVSAFLVATFLHDPPGHVRRVGPVDWLGIGLLTIGVGSLQYVLEEGRRYDWFQDATITRLTMLSVTCLVVMVWWELSSRNKDPVVNFRVLRNRQLAASIFLFVALGFGLYGGVFIFPLFTQTILGFTPTETGLTLMPGGIATAVTALICGRLLNGRRPLVDGRVLIYLGVGLFIVSMWQLGHLTTASGEADARIPLIIRGLGLGFLFTPINNVAYGSLEPHEAQQASGLINLSRQLGGSFGIAILSTYVTSHIQMHRVDLVANTYATNPAFVQRQQMLVQGMIAQGFPSSVAMQKAMAIMDATVNRQAAMLAYNDAWILILWSFVIVAPAIFFLKRPKAPAAGVDAH
jgi:DHA2 family multidrug resistance protein